MVRMKAREKIESMAENTENLEIYVVGGAVRDQLLGREPEDYDFVVVGESEQSMLNKGFKPIEASSFPVFKSSNDYEVALARKERKIGEGYHGFETFTEDITLKEDLERRDFTINSISYDPRNEVYITADEKAMADLNKKVIRHQSDAFKEDPIRVLRMARFAARLGFDVEEETIAEASRATEELNEVAGERIGEEMIKGLKQAKRPSRFMNFLEISGALWEDSMAPEVADMIGVSAGPDEHHQERDLWKHTLMVMDEMKRINGTPEGIMMAMVHDIGKLETQDEENTGGHDKLGVKYAKKIAERWKLSSEYKEKMKYACREHMRIHNVAYEKTDSMRQKKVLDLVERLDRGKGATQEELLDLAEADSLGRYPSKPFYRKPYEMRLALAREVIEEVDAEYVAEKRDKDIGDWQDKEKLGQTIVNDRVHFMKKRENEVYN